jgi:hypothetical protein
LGRLRRNRLFQKLADPRNQNKVVNGNLTGFELTASIDAIPHVFDGIYTGIGVDSLDDSVVSSRFISLNGKAHAVSLDEVRVIQRIRKISVDIGNGTGHFGLGGYRSLFTLHCITILCRGYVRSTLG